MAFRDVIEITVQAGKGGDGGMSFLRLKYMPKGGPDGGHGGDGGSVLLEAIGDISSLDRLIGRRQFKAETGSQGEGRNRNGKQGQDLVISVPVGTTAYDIDTAEVLADLIEAGQQQVIAQGGQGGRGNASFANSTRQTPRFAEFGTPGQKRRVRLELRMIADVGLVGYPNAGKSSLLKALSNARPQIASYPFTTLSPNLGVVERGHERFTMADIPGIIEDAHLGKGLGLEFLRHISRTRLLVYVLDIVENPERVFEALTKELREYDAQLLELPAVIALNKIDIADSAELKSMTDDLSQFGLPVVAVSAEQALNLAELKDVLFAMLPTKRPLEPVQQQPKRVQFGALRVERDMSGAGWRVSGSDIEALVSRFDASNRDAVAYLQHHFKSLGIYLLLKKAGAKDGDDVQIGEAVFDYFNEEASSQEAATDVSENAE